MRVIAGTARGLQLEAPRGDATRPTLDRVREALFSILGPQLPEAAFLDLYAGSGANGIEALSRGARQAVFVDNAPAALDIVRRNLAHTRLAERGRCLRRRLPQGLADLSGPFDIVFADPPYHAFEPVALLEGLRQSELVVPDGWIILEHDARADAPEVAGGFERFRTAKYGTTSLSLYT